MCFRLCPCYLTSAAQESLKINIKIEACLNLFVSTSVTEVLREGRVCENRVLRRSFGLMREKVRG